MPNSQNYREKWSLWTNRNCCSRGGSSRPEEKRYTVLLNLVIMSLLRLLFISFCSDCRCSYCQHSCIRIIIIIHMPFSCSTYYGCVMHSWLLADVSSVSGVFADAFSSGGGDSYAAASCGNPSLAAAVFADLRYKLFSHQSINHIMSLQHFLFVSFTIKAAVGLAPVRDCLLWLLLLVLSLFLWW